MFQIETISAKMLDYYVERSDAVIIDLRDPAAYRRGHVRNAVNIPYRELEEYLEKKQDQKYRFPKDKLLIFYCDRGGAIFFSTHVLEVAEKLCDKVAIIKGGKLIRSGTMEQVKGDDSLEEVFLELEDESC